MSDLLILSRDLADIRQALDRAARLARELSGAEPGREAREWTESILCDWCGGEGFHYVGTALEVYPCEVCLGKGFCTGVRRDPGSPAVPASWPAMEALAGRLEAIRAGLATAVTGEIAGAIDGELEREAANGLR